MSEIIQQVQKRMLVSLAQISKDLNIKEGDHVKIEVKDGGIIIKPVGWHEKNQEYFWTEKWQEKMKRSMDAIDKGEIKTFDNVDKLLEDLGMNEEE